MTKNTNSSENTVWSWEFLPSLFTFCRVRSFVLMEHFSQHWNFWWPKHSQLKNDLSDDWWTAWHRCESNQKPGSSYSSTPRLYRWLLSVRAVSVSFTGYYEKLRKHDIQLMFITERSPLRGISPDVQSASSCCCCCPLLWGRLFFDAQPDDSAMSVESEVVDYLKSAPVMESLHHLELKNK